MDYTKAVGQRVMVFGKKEGVLSDIDKSGTIRIRLDGDSFSSGFLYDPFVNEDAMFLNKEWQDLVDAEIAKILENAKTIIDRSVPVNQDDEKFYITREEINGEKEVICRLNCSDDDAKEVFCYVVRMQLSELQNSASKKWKLLRIYDSKTGRILAQES